MSTRPAAADDVTCEVRFDDGTATDAWSSSLREVRALAATLTETTTDCRLIELTRERRGALVVFTTRDGRVARRQVGAPRDLVPMVEALLVFGHESFGPPPAPTAGAPSALAPSSVVPSSVAASPAPEERAVVDEAPADAREPVAAPAPPAGAPLGSDTTSEPHRPSRRPTAILVGAGAGVKQSWPNDTVAAAGELFAGVTLNDWELAGFARWEIEHDDDSYAGSDAAPKPHYAALGGGTMFGRRTQLGPVLLVGGARAALYDAEEHLGKRHATDGSPHFHEEFLDPRLGLYAAGILTQWPRLRVRVQVQGEAGVVLHSAEVAQLPDFPRWNLGFSLGAETSFVP